MDNQAIDASQCDLRLVRWGLNVTTTPARVVAVVRCEEHDSDHFIVGMVMPNLRTDDFDRILPHLAGPLASKQFRVERVEIPLSFQAMMGDLPLDLPDEL